MRRGHEQADDQSRFQKSEDTANWPDTKRKRRKKKNKVIEVETRYNNIKFCKHFLKKVFLRYDGYTKY